MILLPLPCPRCNSVDIVKYGTTMTGTQRFLCQNDQCDISTFIIDYQYKGCSPDIDQKVLELTMNGCGIRDISRVLAINPNTVISKLKKVDTPKKLNTSLLSQLKDTEKIEVEIVKVDEAEIDEMWSFVGSKENQRWLWWAIDHNTGDVLAFTFGDRKDKVFKELQELLKPFGIGHFYTDEWGAYSRNIPSPMHTASKRMTWKIERKHLNLRTRIKRLTRKTICFSKSRVMHDLIIGLFINIFEFNKV